MTTKTHLVRTWGIVALAGFFGAGCTVSTGAPAEAPSQENPADTETSTTQVAKTGDKAPEEKSAEPKGPALVHHLKDVGLEAPEAIIYDEAADVYLVSNVNGDPLGEDGNGFISKVGPDGKVLELKWIDGQKKGITLNAPKGMAVSKGFIYVSDITWIRVFDRKTGEPKGKIFAKGATFLNDVTTDTDGEIVFSDTGWKSGKEGFASTGSDAVFRVDPKTVAAKEVARGKELGNPNGLAVTKEGVWVVNDQGELFLVGEDGKKQKTTKLAKGGLDGVVALNDGRFLVSSWKGNAIYHGKPGEEFKVLVSGLKSPASIGYDSKRDRVLIPKMKENQAMIFDLSGKTSAKPQSKEVSGKGAADKEAGKSKAVVAPKKSGEQAKPAAKEPENKPTPAAKKTAAKPAAPAATKPVPVKTKPAGAADSSKPAPAKAEKKTAKAPAPVEKKPSVAPATKTETKPTPTPVTKK